MGTQKGNGIIPLSVFQAGFIYGLMYGARMTDTEFGQKRGCRSNNDGFYGQFSEFEIQCVSMEMVRGRSRSFSDSPT